MKTTALEKKYDALNKAHQAETTPAVEQKESDDKTSSEKETDGKTSGEQGPDQKVGADKSTEQDTVDKVMSEAKDNATLWRRQVLIVVTPEFQTPEAIKLVLSSQNVDKMLGRMMAFFDPKCDEEAKTYSSQIFHKRIPQLVKARLESFIEAVDDFMAEGRDFCVIMEGRCKQWMAKGIITDLLTKQKWRVRVFTVNYDLDKLQEFANTGKEGKQKASYWRGFGTLVSSESVYVCWKGKTPKTTEKLRKYLNAGRRCADTTFDAVDVVPKDSLPHVEQDIKSKVFANTTNDGTYQDDSDHSESSQEAGDSAPTKRKYTKRGKGLQRHRSTTEVPFFHHPTPPALLQELVNTLGATWIINGTPNAGVGVKELGGMRIPVVSIARNGDHKDAIEETVTLDVAQEFLKMNGSMCQKPLAERWEALVESSDEEPDSAEEKSKKKPKTAGEESGKMKKKKTETSKKSKKKGDTPKETPQEGEDSASLLQKLIGGDEGATDKDAQEAKKEEQGKSKKKPKKDEQGKK